MKNIAFKVSNVVYDIRYQITFKEIKSGLRGNNGEFTIIRESIRQGTLSSEKYYKKYEKSIN